MDKATAIGKVKQYANLVQQHFDVNKIIIYGSYARNQARNDSDIDVAIVVKKTDKDFFEYAPLLWKLRGGIDSLIEPILIEEDNDCAGFLEEILSYGIIVYNKTTASA